LRIEAVLGPTNTGKTHLAVERMLSHPTGMIGLPLRLLAREVYDSVAALAGAQAVALITGEEKRIPPDPRYFVCTVEAMPTDQRVDFLAIDEVQLAEHDERGHVFTDRILHARGAEETLFLGAAPIEGLLRRLVPSVAVQTRPRLSTLTCIGSRKLHQLPPRSAVIAFSAADVYEIAERLRRRHGGAAVVLGALSPRARNAQVALYEAGEVHHIVATDAIGMGLNLDVDHVAIASLRKFDGTKFRDLRASELAQIAGRAGRFRSNGSFGSMAPLGPLPPSLVEAVETHSFPPITELRFRESRLDFSSVNDLRATLGAAAPEPFLRVQRRADDQRAFDELLERPTLRPHAEREEGLRQLWEVCGVPDFAGRISAGHLQLLAQLFEHLQSGEGGIPEDWVAREIARIDDPEGDFETLMGRIAAIRTWTYISHHPGWVRDPEHWQARSREIEDRLSDALHLGLTQRFVDRRASVVLSRQTRGRECELRVDEAGSVEAAGILVGRLRGVEFEAVAGLDQLVRSLVERGLGPHAEQRIRDLIETPHDAFVVDSMGWIRWRQVPVGRLVRGESALRPSAEPLDSELLDGGMKARLRRGAGRQRPGDLLSAARRLGLRAPQRCQRPSQAARGRGAQGPAAARHPPRFPNRLRALPAAPRVDASPRHAVVSGPGSARAGRSSGAGPPFASARRPPAPGPGPRPGLRANRSALDPRRYLRASRLDAPEAAQVGRLRIPRRAAELAGLRSPRGSRRAERHRLRSRARRTLQLPGSAEEEASRVAVSVATRWRTARLSRSPRR